MGTASQPANSTAGRGQTDTVQIQCRMSEAHRAAAWYVALVVIAAANSGYGATEAERPTCATGQRGTTVVLPPAQEESQAGLAK